MGGRGIYTTSEDASYRADLVRFLAEGAEALIQSSLHLKISPAQEAC